MPKLQSLTDEGAQKVKKVRHTRNEAISII